MADPTATTIDGFTAGPEPADAFNRPASPTNAPKCEACKRYHGSVNEGILCLENEVRRLRARLRLYDVGERR